jgi:predicted dehydrogenase
MKRKTLNRRQFMATGAVAAGIQIVPRHVVGGPGQTPPSERLHIAGVGVGGQGGGNVGAMTKLEQNFVGLCDVDWKRAAGTFNAHPKARKYKDYRSMFAEMENDIDAVVVSTPDHMHAPIALAAMRMGKHVYVEKPMAHSIEEARLMTRVAKEQGVVSQMGNNGHAGEGLRLTREWIQAGAIGKVHEIHCWSDRPGKFWSQDIERPTDTPAIRDELEWNLWLGAAPVRPYHPVYSPVAWRGWFDFGTGAMGDMAIHNMDPAFYALDLDAPYAAEAETSQPLKAESYPSWQRINYFFAAKGDQPALTLTWHDGGKMPPRPEGLEPGRELGDNGIYFVGDKGTLLCGGWAGAPRLIPETAMQAFVRPEKTISRSPGHREEWIEACKRADPSFAKAGFDYSGPYTEALLVGNLATRLQKRIEWDAKAMKATNAPEAEPMIRKTYRDGFGI